jgi:4-hydroxy-tetrahydrodipicolinate reductase
VIRVGIAGIAGRMGQTIARLVVADPAMSLIGGIVQPNASEEEVAAGRAALGPAGGRIVERPEDLLGDIDVLIDFTTPAGTLANGLACARAGVPFVTGVTGLDEDQLAELREFSGQTAVFFARNFSIGVSAVVAVLPDLVRALTGFDIEIVEAHHRHKRDAPSGTALELAETVAAAAGVSLADTASYGREGIAPRQPGEIGIHAVRGGGITGEHTVIFASDYEQVTISHRASDRTLFAQGAVEAARFLAGKPNGFYTMENLVHAKPSIDSEPGNRHH